MDTIVCGATAYQYWRTPPIVLYLAAAPDDSPALRRFARHDEVLAFRSDMCARLPFLRECSGPSWRNVSRAATDIRKAQSLLAPSCEFPLDILAQDRGSRRSSSLLKTVFWNGELPVGATRQITDDLDVTSPAFTMVQLAAKLGLERTLPLASELCGSYAVYDPPTPIKAELQRIANRGRLGTFQGWRPCLDANGKVTELWSRDPLTTPQELLEMAHLSQGHRGSKTLQKVAELVTPLAASPFETQAGLLLGLPERFGGEGFAGLSHNEKIELHRDARLVGQRDCCYCDIYWPNGLDIECQSALYHDNLDGFLSDADRTAALSLMGVNVLPLTYPQLKDRKRFDAFCDAVADSLGAGRRPKTARQTEAAKRLRAAIFTDWATLPNA